MDNRPVLPYRKFFNKDAHENANRKKEQLEICSGSERDQILAWFDQCLLPSLKQAAKVSRDGGQLDVDAAIAEFRMQGFPRSWHKYDPDYRKPKSAEAVPPETYFLSVFSKGRRWKKRQDQRRPRREVSSGQQPDLEDKSVRGPEESAIAAETKGLIEQALQKLSERDRRLLRLRFNEDSQYSDIGRQIGISKDAAKTATHRALSRLKKRLQDLGYDTE